MLFVLMPMALAPAQTSAAAPTTTEAAAKGLDLVFSPDGDGLQAEASLALTARSAGRLQATFLRPGEQPVAAQSFAASPTSALALVARPAGARLRREQSVVLALTWRAEAKTAAESLQGLLELGTGSGRLLLPVRSSVVSDTARYRLAQSRVAVTVTRWLPWSAGSSERDVGVYDEMPSLGQGSAPAQRRSLVSLEHSGSAQVRFKSPPPASTTPTSPDDVQQATVDVEQDEGDGDAVAHLVLGPGEGRDLEVDIRTRDLFIWAVLALVIGAYVGVVIPAWLVIRRRAWLLRADLAGAVAAYREARKSEQASGADGLESADQEVGQGEEWLRGWDNLRAPRKDANGELPSSERGANGLYNQIGRASTAEALSELSDSARAMMVLMSNWRAIDKALADLRDAVRESDSVRGLGGSASRPLHDAEEMLSESIALPNSVEAGQSLVERISGQATALRLYAEASEIHARVKPRAHEIPEGAQRLGRSDPERIYLRLSTARRRSVPRTLELITALDEARDELHYLDLQVAALETGADVPAGAAPQLAIAFMSAAERAVSLVESLTGQHRVSRPRPREDVLRGVRALDWLVFFATLVASALAYLIPLYSGQSWGTLQDYATAFAAGLAGQIVVNTALLPFSRTYKAFPEEAAPTEAGTTTQAV